jgi:hypothetical protein
MTGLANLMINGIVAIAGSKVIIALFLTMLCCIVLGMGVPTTANYCIMAATCAPILIRMGVPVVAVLRELGYTAQQQDKNTVFLSKDEQQLVLDLEKHTLFEVERRNFNYLECPPGDYWAWSFRDGNDVIVDCITFAGTLQLLGSKYRVKEIPEHKIIVVYKRWIDLIVV